MCKASKSEWQKWWTIIDAVGTPLWSPLTASVPILYCCVDRSVSSKYYFARDLPSAKWELGPRGTVDHSHIPEGWAWPVTDWHGIQKLASVVSKWEQFCSAIFVPNLAQVVRLKLVCIWDFLLPVLPCFHHLLSSKSAPQQITWIKIYILASASRELELRQSPPDHLFNSMRMFIFNIHTHIYVLNKICL